MAAILEDDILNRIFLNRIELLFNQFYYVKMIHVYCRK